MDRDFIRAQGLAEQSWQLAERLHDRRGAGFAAANRGATLAITSHIEEALEWYGMAASRFPEDESQITIGRLAAARALALRLSNENDRARAEIDNAWVALGVDDWRLRYATAAIGLWTTLDIFGANDKLEGLLEEAEDSGDASRVAVVLQVLGWSATTAQWYKKAIELYTREIELSTDLGLPGRGAFARRNIGAVHVHMGDPLNATKLLTAALQEVRNLEDQSLEFIILNDLSIAFAQAGDQDKARTFDVEAADVLAAIATELQQERGRLTPSVDYYHFMRMRVLNQPTFLIDPFPWLLDQLALEPTEDGR